MPRFHRAGEDEVEPSPSYAATCRAEGPRVVKRLTPDGFPLWRGATAGGIPVIEQAEG